MYDDIADNNSNSNNIYSVGFTLIR